MKPPGKGGAGGIETGKGGTGAPPVPPGILPGAGASGPAAASRLKWLKRLCWLAAVPLLLALGWLVLPQAPLLPPEKSWSRRVMDREGKLLTVTLADDGRYRLWTPLAELPPDLIAATLAHEDQRFRRHHGVDLRSLARAVRGVISGRRRGGGSTVSMQLARLRFGLETRSWSGKAGQMFRALQLERHYSKERILEAYLNLVPCGGNVEGSGTASWVWLGKPPAALTFRECVALSLVPQRPARRNPARPDADPAAGPLQCAIIQALRGRSDPRDAEFHLTATTRPPRTAPHFTREVLKRSPEAVVVSTLNADFQETVERPLRAFIRQASHQGIRNASALLVHAPSREVRAWVGSADFHNAEIRGQVDGVLARRSPGSVLKPFIYGLGIRQGLILPQSLVSDAPAVFADYNPENFDRGFAGPVTAAEALYRSRNLPAIQLLRQLRRPDFYTFLKKGGVRLPHPAGHYGLALALGAEEVSVAETAQLYALLADDGVPRPLRLTPEPETSAGGTASPVSAMPTDRAKTELLPAGARFLLRDMLHPRNPAPPEEAYTAGFENVSWKTGTSHGWHDAWAAAIAGEYVLVVWVGDFQGKPNPALTGRRAAGPLLFSILGALKLPCPPPAVPPPDLKRADFCAASGDLPGPHCGQRTGAWYLPGVSPVRTCALHQEILIDTATGLRAAADDGRPGLRHEIAEIWPPNLLELFRQAGVPRRQPPPFENLSVAAGGAPRIVSPLASRTYTLRSGDAGRRTIPLRAEAAAGVQKLFWFAGREFLGGTPPSTPWLWTAVPGSSQIRVTDDQGRSSTCPVRVELIL